ncbi:TPA: DUF5420 family protein [Yersinia enterocolitica]
MSSSHRHYDYFKVEGADVKALIDGFDDIGKKRDAVINGVMNEFGAVAYTNSSGFGDKGSKLRNLVWEHDYPFSCPMTIKSTDYFNGKKVVIARGKGNVKEGKEFNKKLDAAIKSANAALESLPVWQAYIIAHYGVMKTGFGESTGRGILMLTTYGGRHPERDDCLLFAIPNTKDKEGCAKHGDVTIPKEFEQITYGQFYDITNTKAA